jgi:23S rRNA (pseudouridine1915-N3)-methyltransferase
MYHLRIISIGKTKEPWLDDACNEYIKRLSHRMSVDFIWLKTDQQLTSALAKENNVVCLDPVGKEMNSEKFAKFVEKSFEKGGTHLTIAIGGPEGLPSEVRATYPLISLSQLTMTHQIVRIVLMEQLYRAMEILAGSPYHK